MRMKVLYVLLLVAGPFGVWGQLRSPSPVDSTWPKIWRVTLNKETVNALQPDRMPCIVPNMMKVERMPVDRRKNAERMPNGVKGEGEGVEELVKGGWW